VLTKTPNRENYAALHARIGEKRKKYLEALRKIIVAVTTVTYSPLNSRGIIMARAATPCLTLFRQFLPFGSPCCGTRSQNRKHSGLVSSVPRQVPKQSGQEISTKRFSIPSSSSFSAVLHSRVDCVNCPKELGSRLLYSPQSERGSWHRPASIPLSKQLVLRDDELLKLSLTLVRADAHNAARRSTRRLGSTVSMRLARDLRSRSWPRASSTT